jgi:hypothetical protein
MSVEDALIEMKKCSASWRPDVYEAAVALFNSSLSPAA